jgi:diguanylate cyclase (GGDEF)-like protein
VNRHVALFSDITEKKRMDAQIWTQANYDPLTNLPNRRLFLDRLEQEIRVALRGKTALALLFIDLDHFKEVNDTLGHQRGDEVLVEAARRIKSCVRDSDTVARLGGDEFTVILGELDDLDSVASIAQKIIIALDQPYPLGKEQAFVSGSVGISIYPHDASDATDLLKKADHAMLAAKQQGRNRFSYFTDEMLEATQERMRLMTDLHRALAAGEFVVVYQPIVDLATGRIDKAEALVRWNRPGEGWLGPAEFLPVAEETGLIRPIGDWVFQEATAHAKRWRATINPRLQININRSQAQFLAEGPDDDEWVDWVAKINLPGDAVAIEIPEHVLFRASEIMNDKLLRLREVGVQLAIDGFGTGLSSLADLQRFDIQYLKIACSFVGRLDTDARARTVSEAIVVMAHKLGLRVIAEGVETENQREILVRIGCDYGQGNAFAPPLSEQEFEALLSGRSPETGFEGSIPMGVS